MDGKGWEGTYIFSHDDWGQGIGHRGSCPLATPLAPPIISVKFPRSQQNATAPQAEEEEFNYTTLSIALLLRP